MSHKAGDIRKLTWTIGAKCLVVGLLGGAASALYRLGIAESTRFARTVYAFASEHPWVIAVIAAAALAAGYAIARLVRWEPMASASGIPQTEGVLSYRLSMNGKSLRILAVRFIGGLAGALFGVSMGREGPCIQIGAASGRFLREKMGNGGLEDTCMVTAGAAAGLSAAFSAPLSGVMFALEEIHRSFSPILMIASAMAALTGAAVSMFAFGLTPVLGSFSMEFVPLEWYPIMIVLGAVVGLLGCGLGKWLLAAQTLYSRVPWWSRSMIALAVAIPFGLLAPDVLGGGDNLVFLSKEMQSGLGMVVGLLVAKIAFTGICFGSGTPGGIFMPTLAMGALAGCAFGIVAKQMGLPADQISACAICGMAAIFASCMKAPFTGILLVTEMTGSLSHLLPLALAAFTALFVSDLLGCDPIYRTLLERYMDTHEAPQEEKDPKRLFDVVINAGSDLDGAHIHEVDWPDGFIIVRVQKAERDVTPHANLKLRVGDHLIAVPVGERTAAKQALRKLAQGSDTR